MTDRTRPALGSRLRPSTLGLGPAGGSREREREPRAGAGARRGRRGDDPPRAREVPARPRLRGQTAASAAEALARLGEARFELMLCDVRMPGMSGTDLLPHALAVDPDLGVLFLSAVNDAPTATAALSTGALDYLTKPVELAELLAAVERVADRRARAPRAQGDGPAHPRGCRAAHGGVDASSGRSALSVNVVRRSSPRRRRRTCASAASHRVADLAATVALELGLTQDDAEAIASRGACTTSEDRHPREVLTSRPADGRGVRAR